MTDHDLPDPVPNVFANSGVFPGHAWPADILNSPSPTAEDDEGLFLDEFTVPISKDPLTLASVSQAQRQFDYLFPDATGREREMFACGVVAVLLWWSKQTIELRNKFYADPDNAEDDLYVAAHSFDDWMGMVASRLVTTVRTIRDTSDLDAAFEAIIDGS